MQEDVLGPRKTVVGAIYDTCVRCGDPVLRGQGAALHVTGEGPTLVRELPGAGTPHPAAATQEEPPPVLCPTCIRAVAAGEPLTLEEPEAPEVEES